MPRTSLRPWLALAAVALLLACSCKAAGEEEHANDKHSPAEHSAHDAEHEAAAAPGADPHEHAEDHEGHSHGLSEEAYAAALAVGEDPCAAEALRDYDLAWHIAAIFIVLAASAAGAYSPIALGAVRSSAVATAVRLGSYFGFGTILATALIHMMLPAVESLGNPCLGWSESYEAWAYAFVLLAVLGTHLVDFVIRGHFRRQADAAAAAEAGTASGAVAGAIVGGGHAHGHGHEHNADPEANEGDGAPCPVHGGGCATLLAAGHCGAAEGKAKAVGVYLVDAGIMFHSVMIGLALGVADGASFTTLLVALSLHQFFEGFALGSASVAAGLGAWKSALLAGAYSLTTPTGTAIGIGVRESFNSNATGALLATGILDSLSAGVLLYVGLVQLVTPELTDGAWLHRRSWWMQVLAFAALWSGAAVMAAIGKWA